MDNQLNLQASGSGDTLASFETGETVTEEGNAALATAPVAPERGLTREAMAHWQDYERDLLELCGAKAQEFHMLGYEEVTASEVWQCVLNLTKGQGALHEMVGAVMGLQAGKFMNYTTINAYRGIFDEGEFDAGNRA